MNLALKVICCCLLLFFRMVSAQAPNDSPSNLADQAPSDISTTQEHEAAYFVNTRVAKVTADMADLPINQYIKLYITRQNGVWVFSQNTTLKDGDSELLFWSPNDNAIFLGATGAKFYVNGIYRCIKALNVKNEDSFRGAGKYDVCESSFLSHTKVGLSVVTGIFSLGLRHYAFYEIDESAIVEALNQLPQSRIIELAAAQRMALANLRLQQEELQKQNEAKKIQLQKQAELSQKIFLEREKEQAIAIGKYRKSIQTGTETNCGPALEIRGNLVKIYRPVANYGNEHWLRLDTILPRGYSCRFNNGEYMPPLNGVY